MMITRAVLMDRVIVSVVTVMLICVKYHLSFR